MKIESAEFIKGIIGTDQILEDNIPQVVFAGRSNVGKSSVINSLVNRKNLVKSGAKPGKTQQINFFLINKKVYFVDLPGYGYAKMQLKQREKIRKMILWYLFKSGVKFIKVILIIDCKVGLTDFDGGMLDLLKRAKYQIIIAANKIDKLKRDKLDKKLEDISKEAEVIPYSAKSKKGREKLLKEIYEEI